MTRLFNLSSFRLLGFGSAKASTQGEDVGNKIEEDQRLYFG